MTRPQMLLGERRQLCNVAQTTADLSWGFHPYNYMSIFGLSSGREDKGISCPKQMTTSLTIHDTTIKCPNVLVSAWPEHYITKTSPTHKPLGNYIEIH